MLRLFRWEWSGFARTKKLRNYLLLIAFLTAAFVIVGLKWGEDPTGVESLVTGADFFGPMLALVSPVLAGTLIASSFEGRQVQQSIMSGKKRRDIILAKYFYFLLVLYLLPFLGLLISLPIYTAFGGFGMKLGEELLLLLANVSDYVLLCVVGYSFLFPLAVYKKKQGSTIAWGLLITLILNSVVDQLIGLGKGLEVLEWIPTGRSYLVWNQAGGLYRLGTYGVLFGWAFLIAGVSHLLFRRMELK